MQGICTNIGNCSKADSGEKIPIPAGGQLVCPECNRELARVGGSNRVGRRPPLIPILAGLLLLLAVGFGAWKLFSGKQTVAAGTTEHTALRKVPDGPRIILRLSGSDTIGSKLAPTLAEEFLKAQGAQDIHRIPGEKDEVSVVGTLPGQSEPSVIEIKAHGIKTAFEDLGAATADIGMASRKIEKEEQSALAQLGDMTSRASENVLGLDGLAIIVNKASSVDALTVDKIRAIFTGKIIDWSQVGGSSGEIRLYARDEKSGAFDTFKKLVLRGEDLASSAKRFENSTELSNEVASDVQGIGFVGMFYILNAKALEVSAGNSVPMKPTPLTVQTEDYLLSHRLYFYTGAASKNPWVRKFIEFSLADNGQAIVGKIGFVDQAITAESIADPEDAVAATHLPPAYQTLIRDAERLPFNFRFRTGSDELDTKAFRDLGRLVQFMSDRSYQGRAVLLLGFADAQGSEDSNLSLSRNRARSVEREIQSEGIRPAAVEGFGEELPVAGNDMEEGREKNRRVEVWLRRW